MRRPRFTPGPQPTFTEPGGDSATMRDMTALAPFETDVDPRRVPVDVEIVVPVYNEAAQLAERITALRTFLDESFPFRALVTIVDNASTDDTYRVARRLAAGVQGVAAMHLPRKGRGYALRSAWSTSEAPSSPTWTSTSRPRCRRCSRSWHRCSRVTGTSRSAHVSPAARTWCAGPSAS